MKPKKKKTVFHIVNIIIYNFIKFVLLLLIVGLMEYLIKHIGEVIRKNHGSFKDKEHKQLKKDFDNWKKDTQAEIKLFKQEKLSHEELY